jgi:uncharacterized RDD family membrane protein YckC
VPGLNATAPRFRVAGFWRRSVAGAIDALVVLPLGVAAAALTAAAGGEPLPRVSELGLGWAMNLLLSGGAAGPAALAVGTFVAALYFFIFTWLRGQTPGKRLLGVKVIDAWGERPSVARAALRTAGYAASAILCSIGFLWIGFDREKRGLHDWLAGTYVVAAPRAARADSAPAQVGMEDPA